MAEQFDLFAGPPELEAVPAAPAPAGSGAQHAAAAVAAPRLILGDCFEVMAAMEPDSLDAIVTDPPYGLEFMGKAWDAFRVDPRAARWSGDTSGGAGAGFGTGMHGATLPAYGKRRTTSTCRTCGKRDAFRNPHGCGEAAEWVTIPVDLVPIEMRAFQHWCSAWAAEAYRILKPGAHLVAFGGPRTHHRLAAGLEDAGFEIRDCLMWLYGSGFPKSLDVGKAIDAAAGAERAVLRPGPPPGPQGRIFGEGLNVGWAKGELTAPATAEAAKWAGWGTGLKPGWEPIVLARKLVDGTIAQNVLKWGTGALNIDGCRIATSDEWDGGGPTKPRVGSIFSSTQSSSPSHRLGRWPANLLLEEASATILDEECGEDHAAGASRFFYTSKASRAEREEGLGELEPSTREDVTCRAPDSPDQNHPGASLLVRGEIRNTHPTVKPVDLMRWLLRLVVPPGGVALDPFVGSGTTLVAAWEEGVTVVGIEREAEYHRIAAGRLAEAMRQGRLF